MIRFKTIGGEIINADREQLKIKDASGVRTLKTDDTKLEIFDFDRFKISDCGEVVFDGQISEQFFPQLLELHKLLNGEAFKDEATLYEMQKSKFRFRSNLCMVLIIIFLDFGIAFWLRGRLTNATVCLALASVVYGFIKFAIPKSPQSGFRFTIIDDFMLTGNFGALAALITIVTFILWLFAVAFLNWVGI